MTAKRRRFYELPNQLIHTSEKSSDTGLVHSMNKPTIMHPYRVRIQRGGWIDERCALATKLPTGTQATRRFNMKRHCAHDFDDSRVQP